MFHLSNTLKNSTSQLCPPEDAFKHNDYDCVCMCVQLTLIICSFVATQEKEAIVHVTVYSAVLFSLFRFIFLIRNEKH